LIGERITPGIIWYWSTQFFFSFPFTFPGRKVARLPPPCFFRVFQSLPKTLSPCTSILLLGFTFFPLFIPFRQGPHTCRRLSLFDWCYHRCSHCRSHVISAFLPYSEPLSRKIPPPRKRKEILHLFANICCQRFFFFFFRSLSFFLILM